MCLIVARSLCAAESRDPPPSRDAIITHQAHLEALVTSCYAEFDLKCEPTKNENIPVIQAAVQRHFRKPTPDTYKSYVLSQTMAESISHSARWYRDGIRERFEYFPIGKIGQGEPRKLIAFDGAAVRELEDGSKTKRAVIASIERAHWNSGPIPDPFSSVFESYGRPWSKVMRDGLDFEIKPLPGNQTAVVEASFSDPASPTMRHVLHFDKEFRIVQRDKTLQLGDDLHPRLYERHLFSQWENLKLDSGEVVPFPKTCQSLYVVGDLGPGQLAVYREDVFSTRLIELNPKLASSLFTIDFPPGSQVRDERK
jgi:hypothetical protein